MKDLEARTATRIPARIPLHYHRLKARIMRDLDIATVKMSTSLMKEADSRKCIIRIHDKIAQILFNHDKEKYLGNGA